MEELIKENQELKEKVQYLENILNRGNAGNSSAYSTIRGMIINKVKNTVSIPEDLEGWRRKDYIQKKERQLMSDLKWEIRVRRISEFRTEHIKQAEEFINNYSF